MLIKLTYYGTIRPTLVNMKIQQDIKEGVFQELDFETPTIEDRFVDSYYKSEREFQPRNRERNYNTEDSYNRW